MVAPSSPDASPRSPFFLSSPLLFHKGFSKTYSREPLITITRALIIETRRSHDTLHGTPDVILTAKKHATLEKNGTKASFTNSFDTRDNSN